MIKKLLPDGPAWEGKESGQMGKLLDAIDTETEKLIEKCLKITNDFFPDTTTVPDRWERAFGLPQGLALTLSERRDRIFARWRLLSTGTMQPKIMEEIFALSGFKGVRVRVLHPGEDPRLLLIGTGVSVYGRLGAEFGASDARFGNSDADTATLLANPEGFRLVKKYTQSFGSRVFKTTVFGKYSGFDLEPYAPALPNSPSFWGLLYIIEDESGDWYRCDLNFKQVFLDLAFFMKPLHMWGIAKVIFN